MANWQTATVIQTDQDGGTIELEGRSLRFSYDDVPSYEMLPDIDRGKAVMFQLEGEKPLKVQPVPIIGSTGKGTEFAFCTVCGGYTPHMKKHTVHTGGITSVRYREADDGSEYPDVSRTKHVTGGWCTICEARDEQEKEAQLQKALEADLAEATTVVSRQGLFVNAGFMTAEFVAVVILEAKISEFGEKIVVVRVQCQGRSPWLKDWPNWQEVRRRLLDDNKQAIFK